MPFSGKSLKCITKRITFKHGSGMEFEWDADKNRQNIAKHGLRFEDAIRIFDGFTVDLSDDRFDYGEPREISIWSDLGAGGRCRGSY